MNLSTKLISHLVSHIIKKNKLKLNKLVSNVVKKKHILPKFSLLKKEDKIHLVSHLKKHFPLGNIAKITKKLFFLSSSQATNTVLLIIKVRAEKEFSQVNGSQDGSSTETDREIDATLMVSEISCMNVIHHLILHRPRVTLQRWIPPRAECVNTA